VKENLKLDNDDGKLEEKKKSKEKIMDDENKRLKEEKVKERTMEVRSLYGRAVEADPTDAATTADFGRLELRLELGLGLDKSWGCGAATTAVFGRLELR
jgi:hypothetical protein